MSRKTVVLVTGARGFIGSRLLANARSQNLPFELVGVDLEDADLRDPAAVAALLARVRPKRVVNLAGSLAKGQGPDVMRAQREHTFDAGAILLDAALEAGVEHMLVPGTIDEFGSRGGLLAPNDPTEPRSYYGLYKLLLREHAAFRARQSSLRVDWFRPFIAYGPGQMRGSMLLPTLFRAAREHERVPVSDGLQQRDFIHVADVVSWMLRALSIPSESARRGLVIHHLGTGNPVSVREVVKAIEQEFPGSRFDLGAIPRRPGEPELQAAAPYASLDPELADWRPRYHWREGIAETAAWWRSQSADS